MRPAHEPCPPRHRFGLESNTGVPIADTAPDHDALNTSTLASVRQHPSTASRLPSGGSADRDPVSGLARRRDQVEVPPDEQKSSSSSRSTLLKGAAPSGLTTETAIESTFSTLRLRTRVTKGLGSRSAGLALTDTLLPPPRTAGVRERLRPRRPRACGCDLPSGGGGRVTPRASRVAVGAAGRADPEFLGVPLVRPRSRSPRDVESYRRPPLDPARRDSVWKVSSLANREISLAALPRGSVLPTEAHGVCPLRRWWSATTGRRRPSPPRWSRVARHGSLPHPRAPPTARPLRREQETARSRGLPGARPRDRASDAPALPVRPSRTDCGVDSECDVAGGIGPRGGPRPIRTV
jgi:hypothetical protein